MSAPDKPNHSEISRFVSTLAGAYRTFYLYSQDNKAFDDIMQNLAKRFKDTAEQTQAIELEITNRSLLYQGTAVGFGEITVHLANQLRTLGYKRIAFRQPLQNRHFFQLLHILSNKDSNESKNEKLAPFVEDGEPKNIGLTPLTSNSLLMRMNDDAIAKRLAPLTPGIVEEVEKSGVENLPDLFSFLLNHTEKLSGTLKNFTATLVEATRDGFFPTTRFMTLFPLPAAMKERFNAQMALAVSPRKRRAGVLGQGFAFAEKGPRKTAAWDVRYASFTDDDAKTLSDFRANGSGQLSSDDLDLAASLLKEKGPNQVLGFCILLRYMGDGMPVNIQEKALLLGVKTWTASQGMADDMTVISLLSSLRQQLAAPKNISLALFPLKNAPIESAAFVEAERYLSSLGNAALPALIAALETEQDRGMRKKLCGIISGVAKSHGVHVILEAVPKATPFLLRNLIMILGDMKNAEVVSKIAAFLTHPQKIVRVETTRSLAKVGGDEAQKALVAAIGQSQDADVRKVAVDFAVQKKIREGVDMMVRVAKRPDTTPTEKRALYMAIGTIGGPQARQFLESVISERTGLSLFNADVKQETAMVKDLIDRMAA